MPSGVRFLAGILPLCNCLFTCYWSNKGFQKKKRKKKWWGAEMVFFWAALAVGVPLITTLFVGL